MYPRIFQSNLQTASSQATVDSYQITHIVSVMHTSVDLQGVHYLKLPVLDNVHANITPLLH